MPVEGFSTSQDWEHFNSSLLIEVTRPTGVFTCTGVAVSKELVLTAAHCLEGEVTKVRIFTQEKYDPNSPAYEIAHFKLHPSYNSKTSRYLFDLAKIQLKDKLPTYIHNFPIFESADIQGKLFRFGFGERNKKNARTVVTPNIKRINTQDNMLELNDKYSYSGDSGGPVYLKKGNSTYVLAIHSTFSFGPQGNFSFNPLLAPHLSWIYSN